VEKVYIGFSYHKNNLLSSTIKAVENSKYSHVYIRKVSKYGEYVYQASGLQVNFMNIDIFKKDNVVVEEYEFELNESKKEEILCFFIKYAGAKYATKTLFKLLAMIAAERVGRKIKFEGDGDETFICSELGAFFCEVILEIDIPEDLDFITPKHLNPIVKAHGKRVI
jgi:hypothetical protein